MTRCRYEDMQDVYPSRQVVDEEGAACNARRRANAHLCESEEMRWGVVDRRLHDSKDRRVRPIRVRAASHLDQGNASVTSPRSANARPHQSAARDEMGLALALIIRGKSSTCAFRALIDEVWVYGWINLR